MSVIEAVDNAVVATSVVEGKLLQNDHRNASLYDLAKLVHPWLSVRDDTRSHTNVDTRVSSASPFNGGIGGSGPTHSRKAQCSLDVV